MIKIMMSAGEISGDIHGASLAKELTSRNKNVHLFGMGGSKMKDACVEIKYDLSSRATVGIIEIISHIPQILYGIFIMKKEMKREMPDLLILIDYQGFNMILARYAKKLGIKTIYYIPPQEWLWGTTKGIKNVSSTVSKILAIFEDEYRIYKNAGANVSYIGNPNLDTVKPMLNKNEFCERLNLNDKFPIFGLFPGSRSHEIQKLLPVLLATAKIIKEKVPNAQFVIAQATHDFSNEVDAAIRKSKLQISLIYGKSHDILAFSNVSIAASGTILMEAAILDAPAIMIYKLSKATYFIGKKVLKIKLPFYAMPNILANREIIPELIQSAATPDAIASAAIELLTSKDMLSRMKEGYRFVRSKLGSPGAVKKAADEILDELKGKI